MEEKVLRMLQGCFMIFKGVSRVFQGSFKKTFKVFKKKFVKRDNEKNQTSNTAIYNFASNTY